MARGAVPRHGISRLIAGKPIAKFGHHSPLAFGLLNIADADMRFFASIYLLDRLGIASTDPR